MNPFQIETSDGDDVTSRRLLPSADGVKPPNEGGGSEVAGSDRFRDRVRPVARVVIGENAFHTRFDGLEREAELVRYPRVRVPVRGEEERVEHSIRQRAPPRVSSLAPDHVRGRSSSEVANEPVRDRPRQDESSNELVT